VEVARKEFQEKLAAAHATYQAERDSQYEIYKRTCTREQGERDRTLAALDPIDEAGFILTHEAYDKTVRGASHIFKRYEERAWKRYEDEAARLRREYGILEEVI